MYLLHRLIAIVPTLLGVAFLVFVSVRMIPGDPAVAIAGERATPQLVAQVRKEMGLDEPILTQFGRYLGGIVRGDFGRSARSRLPVIDEIGRRLPYTLQLTALSLFLASMIGIAIGVASATRPYSILDNVSMIGALAGLSTPVFWLGLMLMLFFSIELPKMLGLSEPLLPPTGAGSWKHLVMPVITLALYSTAIIARMTRASMLEVIGQDYIRTARAKGLGERRVTTRHALRNAIMPVLTVLGLQFGTLLGGSVLTETVFAWPGLGRYLVDAIFFRDYAVVQACVLVIALGFILINLIVDLAYAIVDPRVRYG